MTSDGYRHRSRDAEAVRDAARLSLAAPGVRVYRARVRESADGWTEPWSWEIGEANPSTRSVRLRSGWGKGSPLEELTNASVRLSEAAVQRWPWLADETDSNAPARTDGETIGYQTIEIGRRRYGGAPRAWSDHGDKLRYPPARLLWPLEAILGTTAAARVGTTDVRGESCVRYIGEVQPGEIADWAEIKLIDSPQPGDDWRKLAVDVCIDSSGLVRRTAWSPTVGRRFKPGWLPRLASLLGDSSTSDESSDGERRLWNVVEFWDYGRRVEISPPTDLLDPGDPTPLREVALNLWRKRREYRKRTRQAATGDA